MPPPKIATSPESPRLIYTPVFNKIFLSRTYENWQHKDVRWQLRCVGGPGCGKTTFASLVVEDLKKRLKGTKSAVVSIFLQNSDDTDDDKICEATFLADFLTAIERQLTASLEELCPSGQALFDGNTKSWTPQSRNSSSQGVENLRAVIESQLKFIDRAFLVVDDLDLLWDAPTEYLKLEDELRRLKSYGLKILTTSRVPFKADTKGGDCDVDQSHENVETWWQCSECLEDQLYICDVCKEAGHRCPKPEHRTAVLVQPREWVHFDIGNLYLKDFIKYSLETEHGNLGLSSLETLPPSSKERPNLPPHSALGRALTTPASKMNDSANGLVETLYERFDGNIMIVHLRLEGYIEAETIEAVEAVADRLPNNIVTLFSTGVGRIANKAGLRKQIGLSAIRIIGQCGSSSGLPFKKLKEELRKSWSGDCEGLDILLESDYALEEVLGATEGFLSVRNNDMKPVECFSHDFYYFIKDDYLDILFCG